MSTTADAETPIFGELSRELGDLPEITIHDFESYGFNFFGEAAEEAPAAGQAAAGKGKRRREP